MGGYWKTTSYLKEVSTTEPTVYYDSVTGKPLFVAPLGRAMNEFLAESDVHGCPHFATTRLCGRTCACCARRERQCPLMERTLATTCRTKKATATASISSLLR